MAKYRITAPDGGTYEVTAPDTATQAEVMAYAQKNYTPKPTKTAAQQVENDAITRGARNFTDDMGPLDKLNAGAGKAFADIGLALRQRMGMASRADAAEARRLDAPLMKTGAGVAGNIMGNVSMLAPAALAPGAQAVPAAATIGAIAGYLNPSVSAREDVTNTALGAAGGAGGQWLANKAAGSAAFQRAKAQDVVSANAQKTASAQQANKAGYVVPPEDIGQGGGVLSKIASGFGGKIKTAQEASFLNQPVTDKLARQAIGLAPDDALTADVLQTIRNQAATQGYAPIRGAGTVQADKQFVDALDKIAATQQGAARSFPGLADNGVVDLIAKLKQPAFDAADAIDATRVLRETADKAYRQGDKTLGKASKAAADALESALERHLTAAGNPEALSAFRDARTLIAKTYSVQKGLNSQTGAVSADALGKQLAKGAPLTGELRTIAETAGAFPKATQALKEAPKALSPLDMAVAAGGAVSGNPMMMAWLGRPLARKALLSDPMQQAALRGAQTPANANAMLRILENENLMMPAGIAAGNAMAASYR